MQRMIRTTLAVVAFAAVAAAPALADGPASGPRYTSPAAAAPVQPQAVAPAPTQAPIRAAPIPPAQIEAATAPRTGQISLANGAVLLNVPAGYLLYSPAEAQAYLQRASAPAPNGQILGLLAPAGTPPTSGDFWGAVIAYEPIGHVASDGATSLTSAEMAANTRAARQQAGRGFEGFIAQPAFDAGAASLVWAERTAPDAPGVRNLRYEERLLGRSGVVSFVTIGRFDQLDQIRSAAPTMLQMASFLAGQRYADFNPSSDQASRYDLPGLVTGRESGVAQVASTDAAPAPAADKQGFLGGAGIQGMFPWIAGGVVALAALGWLVLGRRRKPDTDDDEAPAQA